MSEVTTKLLSAWSRDELLALPSRKWDTESIYDSIMLLPDKKKHDSGWRFINIIGVRSGVPVEIAAFCDDVNWEIADARRYGPNGIYATANLRMDCAWKSKAIHAWVGFNDGWSFRVGPSLSSTTVVVGKAAP